MIHVTITTDHMEKAHCNLYDGPLYRTFTFDIEKKDDINKVMMDKDFLVTPDGNHIVNLSHVVDIKLEESDEPEK